MTKTRVSKKSLAAFPSNIAAKISELSTRFSAKSFTYVVKSQGQSFYFDEGAKVFCFYGDQELSLEMVSENTLGASNVRYEIGATITPKAGSTIIEISYLGGYFMTIYNFTETAIKAA